MVPLPWEFASKTAHAYQGRRTPFKTRLPCSSVPVHSRELSPSPSCKSLRAQGRVSKESLPVPVTPTSPRSRDPAGPVICGLLSSPDVLLCHVEDWRGPSKAKANATCPGVMYDQPSQQVTLRLGGQEFKSKSLPSARVPSGLFSSPAAFSGASWYPEEVTPAKKLDQNCRTNTRAASLRRPTEAAVRVRPQVPGARLGRLGHSAGLGPARSCI